MATSRVKCRAEHRKASSISVDGLLPMFVPLSLLHSLFLFLSLMPQWLRSDWKGVCAWSCEHGLVYFVEPFPQQEGSCAGCLLLWYQVAGLNSSTQNIEEILFASRSPDLLSYLCFYLCRANHETSSRRYKRLDSILFFFFFLVICIVYIQILVILLVYLLIISCCTADLEYSMLWEAVEG